MTDHCCAHPKCPGGSLCCCQGQPDPIDVEQLTTVILRTELPGGIKVGHANKIALAVKNYLTGVEQ